MDVLWDMLPGELQRMIRMRLWALEIAEDAAASPRGWLTYANRFFPVIVREEPRHITESLVRKIWSDYRAAYRDPWRDAYVGWVVDLGREYQADGTYKRIIQFYNAVYESAPSR